MNDKRIRQCDESKYLVPPIFSTHFCVALWHDFTTSIYDPLDDKRRTRLPDSICTLT